MINFVFIALISFLPIGSYLIYTIEKEYHSNIKPPEKVDGILILGGATMPQLYNEYNQISLNGSSERLVESVFIIKKFVFNFDFIFPNKYGVRKFNNKY